MVRHKSKIQYFDSNKQGNKSVRTTMSGLDILEHLDCSASFRRRESICQLREFYDFGSMKVLFAKAKTRFDRTLIHHENAVLRFLSHINCNSV